MLHFRRIVEPAPRPSTFRYNMRGLENEADGLLLSFIGKLPGLAVRLSLILTYLDWLTGRDMKATIKPATIVWIKYWIAELSDSIML